MQWITQTALQYIYDVWTWVFSRVIINMNLKPGKNRRTTPEGEPLEDTGGGGGFPGGGKGGFFREDQEDLESERDQTHS